MKGRATIKATLPACNCGLWRPATFHISILGISRSALVGVALDSLHPSSSLCHRFWSLQEERSCCHLNPVNRGCVYLTEVKIFRWLFQNEWTWTNQTIVCQFIVHTPKLCWILEVKFGSRLSLFEKNTENCYTIDALGAIFATFTMLDNFTILLQYYYNTLTILLQYYYNIITTLLQYFYNINC